MLAGFAWDLYGSVGAATAESLLMGAVAANPHDMQATVLDVFLLASLPFYGGAGDPATSPLYPAICAAAASHGFDCPARPDWGSHVCFNDLCGPVPAIHHTTGTEWLGDTVVGTDFDCVLPPFNTDDDGAIFPHPVLGGTLASVTVEVSVNPALQGTGRYGGTLPGGAPNPLRYVYLNGWMFVDDGFGGFDVTHILGTDSISSASGPAPLGGNTVAFDPDTWLTSSTFFTFDVPLPPVPATTPAIYRFRVDYGEDAGKLMGLNKLMDPALGGPCGPSRFGEVEDHHFHIDP